MPPHTPIFTWALNPLLGYLESVKNFTYITLFVVSWVWGLSRQNLPRSWLCSVPPSLSSSPARQHLTHTQGHNIKFPPGLQN